MPEQDFEPGDVQVNRFDEMRRLIDPMQPEVFGELPLAFQAIGLLIDEVEMHGQEIGALGTSYARAERIERVNPDILMVPPNRFDSLRELARKAFGQNGWQQELLTRVVDELEQAADGRGAQWRRNVKLRLDDLSDRLVDLETPRMTRTTMIGDMHLGVESLKEPSPQRRVRFEDERLPVEVTTKLAEQGVLVEYPEGSPAHLAELRAALEEARSELGKLYSVRQERDTARYDRSTLTRQNKAYVETLLKIRERAETMTTASPFRIPREVGAEIMFECEAVLDRNVEGWRDEDGD